MGVPLLHSTFRPIAPHTTRLCACAKPPLLSHRCPIPHWDCSAGMRMRLPPPTRSTFLSDRGRSRLPLPRESLSRLRLRLLAPRNLRPALPGHNIWKHSRLFVPNQIHWLHFPSSLAMHTLRSWDL